MFENYKDKYNTAYELLFNEIKSGRISHAYLIDENGNSCSYDLILNFVKAIICGENNEDQEMICKRIDDGNYPELKIIEPDGMFIKKQQILSLQQEFSRSSIEGNKRVYIIKNCDKMRPEAANAMLKFLEEPEDNIVAILMTNNYNSILPTIISRCQIIKLPGENTLNKLFEYDKIILDFIISLEKDGKKVFLNKDNFWNDKTIVKDRELLCGLFDIMIDMYDDIVNLKSGIKNIKYNDYLDQLLLIANKNEMNELLKKINYLVMVKDSIKFNVNINLLMDDVIINVGG